MKTRIFYKVTYENRSFSEMARCMGHSLTYEVGVKTIPKYGKIFVFEKPEDVVRFVEKNDSDDNLHSTLNVFVGFGTNPHGIKIIKNYYSNIFTFWENKKKKKKLGNETSLSPKGTIVVDDFTAIEKFTYEQFVRRIPNGKNN
jgi:hypothetical protein